MFKTKINIKKEKFGIANKNVQFIQKTSGKCVDDRLFELLQ